MLLKRILVWLMVFTFVFVRVPAFAQSAHDEGVAAGNAANPVIRGLVTTPSATAVVPGYTTTPPETAYAKKASFGADIDAKLAACTSTPNDPTCEALRNAIASANTPRPALGPGDPAVLAARRIAQNPSTDLGSLAAYYSGCATTDAVSPPSTFTRQCARYVGIGSHMCSDRLTVAIDRSATPVTALDTWNNQCPTLASGSRCSVTSARRCVDGPSTKVIDGVPVTRACWEYQSNLSCAGSTTADQCAPLVAAGCTPLASSCVRTDPTTGLCEVFDEQYRCAVPGETTTIATHCPTDVFCLGASCFNIRSANDADFGRTMTLLEAAREAGVYLDKDRMEVFAGESDRCRDKLLKNCCYTNGAGASMTNQGVFGIGTKLVYDLLTNAQNREFVKSGMSALLTGGSFTGTFTSYGFTVALHGTALPAGSTALYATTTSTGTSVVVAFDPWSLVIVIIIYVVMSMMSCNEGESRLALKEGAKLCRTIGTYCSSCIRVLGKCISCIERTTSKCCFNSVLARLVNEQGRLQVGKGWGGSRNPDCSGFTVAQLQSLDFAAMDLSEFYASIVPESPHLGTLQTHNASRIPNCYFGQGKC